MNVFIAHARPFREDGPKLIITLIEALLYTVYSIVLIYSSRASINTLQYRPTQITFYLINNEGNYVKVKYSE